MFVRVIVSLMVVVVIAIVGLTVLYVTRQPPTPPGQEASVMVEDAGNRSAREAALAELMMPEFILVDQNGTMQNQSLLDGHYTVLTVIFTNCPYACPIIMEATVRVQDETEGTGLRFVSMSVDPVHDTPPVLKAYAQTKGVDESRWALLTGPEGAVATLVERGFKMYISDDDALEITLSNGTVMKNVIHPTKLILLGPDRRVIEIYESSSPSDVDRLIARAKSLAG